VTYPIVSTGPGVTRQVLAQSPGMMVVAFRFDVGAEGPVHSHPHLQSTYVASGRFRFVVGAASHDLGPGDSLVIPADVPHGCTCVVAGELIDTFAPRRDDFL
jgi:quercetin dioxygenase-like cupin family protein